MKEKSTVINRVYCTADSDTLTIDNILDDTINLSLQSCVSPGSSTHLLFTYEDAYKLKLLMVYQITALSYKRLEMDCYCGEVCKINLVLDGICMTR